MQTINNNDTIIIRIDRLEEEIIPIHNKIRDLEKVSHEIDKTILEIINSQKIAQKEMSYIVHRQQNTQLTLEELFDDIESLNEKIMKSDIRRETIHKFWNSSKNVLLFVVTIGIFILGLFEFYHKYR